MKRAMAAITALMIGMSYCPPGSVVMAAEDEGIANESIKLPGVGELETLKDTAVLPGNEMRKEAEEVLDVNEDELLKDTVDIRDELEESVKSESADKENPGNENLQIPQKMAVVIDPWEMDGQGQIYSEQYVVRNMAKTAGILTISGSVCKSPEQSEVIVRSDKEGMHEDETKSIYMEMEFGDGERIVLSREGSEYQIELQPGEELLVHFIGEVNEYASDEWKDGDITVDAVYSWKMEEPTIDAGDISEDDMKTAKEEKPSVGMLDEEAAGEEKEQLDEEVAGEEKEQSVEVLDEEITGQEKEQPVEVLDEEITGEEKEQPVEALDEEASDEEKEQLVKATDEEATGEEQIRTIDMQMPQSLDIAVGSWEIDENGQIISEQYIIRNAGEIPGTLVLSDLICMLGEQSEVVIRTEKDKLHDDEKKAVYMEMVSGKEEKVILYQESKEEARYEVKLNPGEEVSIRFVGELNGIAPENLEEGEITVTAICSWILEETVSE